MLERAERPGCTFNLQPLFIAQPTINLQKTAPELGDNIASRAAAIASAAAAAAVKGFDFETPAAQKQQRYVAEPAAAQQQQATKQKQQQAAKEQQQAAKEQQTLYQIAGIPNINNIAILEQARTLYKNIIDSGIFNGVDSNHRGMQAALSLGQCLGVPVSFSTQVILKLE